MTIACSHVVAFETSDLGESIHDGCQQIQQDLLIFNNKTVQGFLD
ncbi:MAG: hypothetical protein CM15mP116_03790 [Synechococcus sp.]|nr:MAG: hypothetical protein CM15mP116_03790 [Synechococcus sp.]